VLQRIHSALDSPGDELEVESGMLALREIATTQFSGAPATSRDVPLARRLRELLDQSITSSLTIADAAREFGTHPSHLVRAFSQAYGIPPHRYLTGRRVDLARRLLRNGTPPAAAAAAAGFHDQSHLTRHFRRVLGTTPGTFAA
jgi:AraC-like DNA-binding protein